MFGCCTQCGSQHGRNIVAIWGEEGGILLMLDVARNTLATCTQRARNMLATFTRQTLDLTTDD
jgi:hypothetical protein